MKFGLVDRILEELLKLRSWFERQIHYKFYGSSILIAYDAKCLMEDANMIPDPYFRVRMIDFAYAEPNDDSNRTKDENYIYGLERLIMLFQNLNSFSKGLEVSVNEGKMK